MAGSNYVSPGNISSSGSSTHTSSNHSGIQASGGRGSRSDRQGQWRRKPVTCYGCGETGHIRPNCPNKVRRVKPLGCSSVMVVDGCLAGMVARNLRIDTGADHTVVRKDYIPEVAYTGKHINLDSGRGSQPSNHKLAQIAIRI